MDNFNIHDWQIKQKKKQINEISAIERHAHKIVDTVEEMQDLLKWVKDAFVNLSLGISTDEMQRVNKSRHKWCKHIFPLIELKWDRQKCEDWLISNFDFKPGRSACLGCPYHSNEFFKNLSKEEFDQVVEFDEKIRNLSSDNYEWFISRDRIPIKDLDLSKLSKLDIRGLA